MSPWVKRQDSVPVSMMWARWVTRSTTALARRGSGKTRPHSPNGRLVVMISEARNYMATAWWLGTFPALAIMLVVGGFNLLGDGLRDALDPREQ